METSIKIRKTPVQARSKARVEQILKAAEEMISDHGSDGLKMSAVAKRADVPIGTVYQFFPNKSALIQTLATSVMSDIRDSIDADFIGVSSLADAADRIEISLRAYQQFLKSNPTVRDILCSTQGDKKLQQLDLDDSRKNGETLLRHLKPLVDDSQHDQLATMCFMNTHLTGALVRMTVELDDDEAESLMNMFITNLRTDITNFTGRAEP
ncbi:TetR family transcriptional regulator [uncultured Tateyamaria sp.]|nr:TetR family transcriptional regulator [uncultured Tateyamaria sp.]